MEREKFFQCWIKFCVHSCHRANKPFKIITEMFSKSTKSVLRKCYKENGSKIPGLFMLKIQSCAWIIGAFTTITHSSKLWNCNTLEGIVTVRRHLLSAYCSPSSTLQVAAVSFIGSQGHFAVWKCALVGITSPFWKKHTFFLSWRIQANCLNLV